MQTIIRQASIDDKIAIWDFIKRAYGDFAKYKIPERWNWEYLENPSINKNRKELPIFIAIKDGQIVGQICAIIFQIKIGEELHIIAGGVDLIVLPICRGEGVGERLIQAIANHYKLYIAISMGAVTRRIYDRLGYNSIEPIPIYRRLVNIDRQSVFRFLMRKTKSHLWLNRIATIGCRFWFDKVISLAANLLIGLRDLFELQTKKECRSDIREVERFSDGINQLWKTTSRKYKVIVKRDQQYLNWRFTDNKQLNYRSFISAKNGETRGYIVLRMPEPIELNVGIIVDLYTDPDDRATVEDLIRHAINFFGKRVALIEFPTTQKEYQRVLLRLGFLERERVEPIFFCMDPELKTKLEEWKNLWFLTKADHDWDQLRPA